MQAFEEALRHPDCDPAARFGEVVRALGFESYALGFFVSSSGPAQEKQAPEAPSLTGVVTLGDGAMLAAARAYLALGIAAGDPIAQRLTQTRDGFTLEDYFARPVNSHPGETLAEVIANLEAHGLRNVAMAPVAGPRGAPHGALALAGPAGETATDFATRFAAVGWLALIGATALTARFYGGALDGAPALSDSERSVVECLARGLRPREIAERLGKSERTVSAQIDSARHRLGALTNAQLVARALAFDLIRI